MTLVDSHCHLTDRRLFEQADEVIVRARDAGVTTLVTVGCGREDSDKAVELATRFDGVYAAVAIHPHDAKSFTADSLAWIERLQGQPKVVALGEIGLDYHYDFSPRDVQRVAFDAQLRLATRLAKPVIIHSREAVGESLEMITRARAEVGEIGGVFHSFTGTADEADAVLVAGFFISLSGIVTFRNSVELQAVARRIPADRLLVETDAPYLSPEPVRKQKVNEPANVAHTLRFIAGLRGVSAEELARQTTDNARRLFDI